MSRTQKLSLISTAFALAFVLAAGLSVTAQQSIVNSPKSNTKDYRVAPASEVLLVDLNKASGEKVASLKMVDADNDGKLSDAESAFDFGALPAGGYTLTLRSVDGKIDTVKSDLTARVTVTGAVDVKVEKDWKLETNKTADASRQRQRLGGLSSELAQLRISFKADGKDTIRGNIMLPNLAGR